MYVCTLYLAFIERDIILALWLYQKSTKALDKVGGTGLWVFAAVLTAVFIVDLKFVPPANPYIVSLMGFSQLLFVAWAYWIDDHRKNI